LVSSLSKIKMAPGWGWTEEACRGLHPRPVDGVGCTPGLPCLKGLFGSSAARSQHLTYACLRSLSADVRKAGPTGHPTKRVRCLIRARSGCRQTHRPGR
jgi:hypothetical protein